MIDEMLTNLSVNDEIRLCCRGWRATLRVFFIRIVKTLLKLVKQMLDCFCFDGVLHVICGGRRGSHGLLFISFSQGGHRGLTRYGSGDLISCLEPPEIPDVSLGSERTYRSSFSALLQTTKVPICDVPVL